MTRTDSRYLLPAIYLVLAACRRQSPPISTAELQLTEVRCEDRANGRYLDSPATCHSALDRYLEKHPSERIATVIPLAPWPPHRYYGTVQPDETASLLVLHTTGSGPWPLGSELTAYENRCEHGAARSPDYDCDQGPGLVDEPEKAQVYLWAPIDDPLAFRGGTESILQVSRSTYPVPPRSSWPIQASVQRSRVPCIAKPHDASAAGPDACQGALEDFLRAHPTEHIGPVLPVVTTPQDPLQPGTQVLFVEHTDGSAPWPTADRLAIADTSCLERAGEWDCASALDEHRRSGITQWIPLIADCNRGQLCTREILYLYQR